MNLQRPLRLLPNRVWRSYKGGKYLDVFRGLQEPLDNEFPEDWLGSTVISRNAGVNRPKNDGLGRVRRWDGKIQYLKSFLDQNSVEVFGEAHVAKFGSSPGVLLKLIDSAQRLSFQVHPSRQQALHYFGSPFGKNEAWFVLRVRNENVDPHVYLGFKPHVKWNDFTNNVAELNVDNLYECLHKIPVQPGDAFFVPSGMPHAIGEGLLIAEIQEPTDYTISIDSSQFSTLDLPNWVALSFFDFRPKKYEEVLKNYQIIRHRLDDGDNMIEKMEARGGDMEKYFGLEKRHFVGKMGIRRNQCYIALVIEGRGKLVFSDGFVEFRRGDAFFFPRKVAEGCWVSNKGEKVSLLHCFPPRSAGN